MYGAYMTTMTEYTPTKWVVIKIETNDSPVYKVFGTWMGGFLGGDSWRLNSGVSSVEEDGDFLLFHGFSGSVYRVHKSTYGTSAWTGGILINLIKDHTEIDILPDDTDWLNFIESQR